MVAECLVDGFKRYLKAHPKCSVTKIGMIVFDDPTFDGIKKAIDAYDLEPAGYSDEETKSGASSFLK